MGGRGALSVSGWNSSNGHMSNVGGAPDKREDIQKSFVDELGFKEVTGTNNIPTATLNSYAIALKGLEKEYGAIAASDNPIFTTGNSDTGVLAAVYSNPNNSAQQYMVINSGELGSTSKNLATYRAESKTGYFTKSDGRITNDNAYTVTHEYGHMLHNALAAKVGQSRITYTENAQSEIEAIAKSKYNAKGNVSGYGTSNPREFFAESFASLNSGNPNAYGKALGDWLKTHKLK